jgi:hypothetical protein
MGGTAPAHQPRLSFTGSEDGEAETETWSGEALVANDDSTLRPARAQLAEPPYADPPVRRCGRGEQVTAPPIPIQRRILLDASAEHSAELLTEAICGDRMTATTLCNLTSNTFTQRSVAASDLDSTSFTSGTTHYL